MAGTARVVVPNLPYHITQRGNDKQNVFDYGVDRIKYPCRIDEDSIK